MVAREAQEGIDEQHVRVDVDRSKDDEEAEEDHEVVGAVEAHS